MDPITSPAYQIIPGLPVNIDVQAYRGDTWQQKFRLKQGSPPNPIDLTQYTVESSIRSEYPASVTYDLVCTTDATDPGSFILELQKSGTPPDYPPPGNYAWDVQLTDDGTPPTVTTWIAGRFTLEKDVTG